MKICFPLMIIGNFGGNSDDKDVKRFLKFFTEIETKKIDKLIEEETDINKLKILLANETTKILHGENSC